MKNCSDCGMTRLSAEYGIPLEYACEGCENMNSSNQIIDCPSSDYIYEFQVVIPVGDGTYKWVSNHENVFEAEQEALRIGGVVAHNVRVQHKKLK